MKEILTTKIQSATFEVQKAGLTLAAGNNPFTPAKNGIDELRGWIIPVGLAGLAVAAVVTLIIFGIAGREKKQAMKDKLGGIILAAMGIGIIPGALLWAYTWGKQTFGY